MTTDTIVNDFIVGQFKALIKQMAALMNFYFYLIAFLSPKLFGAWNIFLPQKVLLKVSSVLKQLLLYKLF